MPKATHVHSTQRPTTPSPQRKLQRPELRAILMDLYGRAAGSDGPLWLWARQQKVQPMDRLDRRNVHGHYVIERLGAPVTVHLSGNRVIRVRFMKGGELPLKMTRAEVEDALLGKVILDAAMEARIETDRLLLEAYRRIVNRAGAV